MIDQSNRAGKSNITHGEDLDGQNRSYVPTSISARTTITKRHNHSKRNRESAQIKKKSHRQTNSTRTPVTSSPSSVVFRRPALSHMTKGKSI
jgi:hypothetical protein